MSSPHWIPPEALRSPSGRVTLAPLELAHSEHLFAALDDPETWRLRPDGRPATAAVMRDRVERWMAEAARGERRPFAVIIAPGGTPGDGPHSGGEVVGTTGFLGLRRADRGLEIGATMLSPRVQRSHVNTECKLTLLSLAFERLGCNRVEFKVDERNIRSRNAVLRIGAVFEGILRCDRLLHDGFVRSTCVFSIVRSEWPSVKSRLELLLRR